MNKLLIPALALMVSPAFADELLVTSAGKGGAQAIAVDYVSSGQAVAFDFRIQVPGGEKAKVDLSGCMAGLPKSHTGQCSFVNGMVIGFAYNDTNEALPAGVFKVGTVRVSSTVAGKPEVVHFLAADRDANKIDSVVRADSAEK